jgi:reverse gyrase
VENREFRDLVSEERTRIVEKLMDDVEVGERDYLDVINELFNEALGKGILRGNAIT